jgi:DNA-binding NtrC family response regulator
VTGTAARIVTVLSVSPLEADQDCLQEIFSHSSWILYNARTLPSALKVLQQHEISVVLCERDLRPGTWKDLLEEMKPLPDAPVLLVASRSIDERLWAEALNWGVYDVLTKPFDTQEVLRAVSLAWQHWKVNHQLPAGGLQTYRAATAERGRNRLRRPL